MVKIVFILITLLSLLFLVNTCAAVEFYISPKTKIAHPGEIISYGLEVNLTGDDEPDYYPIFERFSIDSNNSVPGWDYSFSKDSVMLDNSSPINSSILYITVPSSTAQGNYSHRINSKGYDSYSEPVGLSTEFDVNVVYTDVQSPDFPSIALPVAAVLGLLFIIRHKKEI